MKHLIHILLAITTVCLIFSCNPQVKNEEKIISVSIAPQRYFVEAIVGDKFTVNTAMPSGSNPETYDPSPSQMVSIGKSKIYFKVGELGFEDTWLKNISVNSPDMKIIDCSIGVNMIEDNGHHGYDPHIWNSSKNALTIANNIYKAIVEFDKENQEYYLKNFRNLEKLILDTDSIIHNTLKESDSKAFVIYHPSLSYFANEYSLKQYTIEDHGKSPSPQHMAQLINDAKKDSVRVVFVQEEFDLKNTETIAKELNAQIISINPLAYEWKEEMIKIANAIARNDEQ